MYDVLCCIKANTCGNTNSAARVEAISPPITALPNGADCSPDSPMPDAMGIIPATMAMLVIKIGRNLIEALVIAAREAFR